MMIGSRIKAARKARKRSQEWLASETGVNQSSVSQWEKGLTEPATNNLSRIAQVLRISYDWLATGRGDMELSYTPVAASVAEPMPVDQDLAELVALFEQLPRARRQTLLQFMRDWINVK
ncbi:helix-turn-helix domain-containing protein [Chromobacterium haemolyticum]|uniref:HTH cro/C1-type domain-containing protein n=2 Tax=Chromobacterium haemolyticum TaxID=394935 RepID=A0A1W0CCL3_9NEIS|nr:helix-turn-helix domain-containing protein [Chromobacterium haemolyticum]OQS32469.1 hypothetical protein B0T45_21685 [Chromobacterium haemolyticum]